DQPVRSAESSKSNSSASLGSGFGSGSATERRATAYSTCPSRAVALSASNRSVRTRCLPGSKSIKPTSTMPALSSTSAGHVKVERLVLQLQHAFDARSGNSLFDGDHGRFQRLLLDSCLVITGVIKAV